MLATLTEAAHATGNHGWLVDAVQTAEFLLEHLRRPDGRWLRSWQARSDSANRSQDDLEGRAQHLAYAADYGAVLDAFTRLAEATGEARWVEEARRVADDLIDLFWDDDQGGVFTTGRDAEALVTRPKDLMDNATPSANSLAAVGLLRLAGLTGDEALTERAAAILRLLSEPATRHPMAFGHLLGALDLWNSGTTEVAVVGDRPDLVRAVAERYRPNTVLAWGEPYPSPLWDDRDAGSDGAGQAYVCRNFACQRPVTGVDELAAQLAT
jgi:uncharacterized protein YyaL (SSP411 family)